jgi:hypothetical protein
VNRSLLHLALLVGPILTGCTTTKLLDFTLLSNRSIQLSDGRFSVGTQRISGEDMAYLVFVVPVGQLEIGEALSRAIDSHPECVALQDGTILVEQRTVFPLLYSDARVVVEGFPVTESPEPTSAEP